jgi:hypothetical protein
MYRLRATGQIFAKLSDLQELFSNVYLPDDADAEYFDTLGVDLVQQTPAPIFNEHQEASVTDVKEINGTWQTVWTVSAMSAERIAAFEESKAWQVRSEAKEKRTIMVDAIVVAVNSKQFNGDETSQNRMVRAIIAMQAAGVATLNWTTADNVNQPVTLAELTTALVMAGQAQAAAWKI